MTRTRSETIAGIIAGAICLPFAIYVSIVLVGNMLGGLGWSVAGKPGAIGGSFGGALVSCAALVFASISFGRLVAREFLIP
jgi:hypothetical protein